MNSALQALSATVPFMAYMTHPGSSLIEDIRGRISDISYLAATEDKSSDETIVLDMTHEEIQHRIKISLPYALRATLKHIWAHNCEVKPVILRKRVRRDLKDFAQSVQHDSQEFLSALIDNVHEATRKVGNIKIYKDMMKI